MTENALMVSGNRKFSFLLFVILNNCTESWWTEHSFFLCLVDTDIPGKISHWPISWNKSSCSSNYHEALVWIDCLNKLQCLIVWYLYLYINQNLRICYITQTTQMGTLNKPHFNCSFRTCNACLLFEYIAKVNTWRKVNSCLQYISSIFIRAFSMSTIALDPGCSIYKTELFQIQSNCCDFIN